MGSTNQLQLAAGVGSSEGECAAQAWVAFGELQENETTTWFETGRGEGYLEVEGGRHVRVGEDHPREFGRGVDLKNVRGWVF